MLWACFRFALSLPCACLGHLTWASLDSPGFSHVITLCFLCTCLVAHFLLDHSAKYPKIKFSQFEITQFHFGLLLYSFDAIGRCTRGASTVSLQFDSWREDFVHWLFWFLRVYLNSFGFFRIPLDPFGSFPISSYSFWFLRDPFWYLRNHFRIHFRIHFHIPFQIHFCVLFGFSDDYSG